MNTESVRIAVPAAIAKHGRDLIVQRYPSATEEQIEQMLPIYIAGYLDWVLVQHRALEDQRP